MRFAEFDIDVDAAELRRNGQPVKIEPQVFDLIVFLASRPGRILSREDIVDGVWHGRAVSDSAISTRINAARRALGDDGTTKRFIKTVHGRGFRFEVPVAATEGVRLSDPTNSDGARPDGADRAASVMASQTTPSRADAAPATALMIPDRPSIAVMPFANLSGDPEDGHFADGIAEDLITDMSRFEDLFVVSSTTTLKYKSRDMTADAVARELCSQFVLEGSVRKSGQRVRITTQLFSAYEGRRVWSERYDGTLEDVFGLQERVAGQVAGNVAYKVRTGHLDQAVRVPFDINSAHQIAWHAQAIWGEAFRVKDPSKVDEIIELAKTSVKLDPKCAIAYQTLCDGYASKGLFRWGTDPSDANVISERWAKEYLLHFPNSYMAYYHLARARFQLARFDDASRDYRIAHSMNPNDLLVLRYWSWCEAGAGDFENAKRHALLAIRLSPMDPRMHISYLALAMCAFIERSNSEFEEWAEKAINMLPSAPIRRAMMISYAAENGRRELMETHLNELMSWAPDFIDSLFRGENRPFQKEEHMNLLLNGLRRAGFPKRQASSQVVAIGGRDPLR